MYSKFMLYQYNVKILQGFRADKLPTFISIMKQRKIGRNKAYDILYEAKNAIKFIVRDFKVSNKLSSNRVGTGYGDGNRERFLSSSGPGH